MSSVKPDALAIVLMDDPAGMTLPTISAHRSV
jgi:hypothetical protein